MKHSPFTFPFGHFFLTTKQAGQIISNTIINKVVKQFFLGGGGPCKIGMNICICIVDHTCKKNFRTTYKDHNMVHFHRYYCLKLLLGPERRH